MGSRVGRCGEFSALCSCSVVPSRSPVLRCSLHSVALEEMQHYSLHIADVKTAHAVTEFQPCQGLRS